MKRIFNDDFNGFDPRKWKKQDDAAWPNHSSANKPTNVKTVDGLLGLSVKAENYRGSRFTSGMIISHNKFAFRYGYVEIRAKLSTYMGLYNAFWLMPQDPIYAGDDHARGEIDIMELLGRTPTVGHSTIHYGIINETQSGDCTITPDWHTYGMVWEPRYFEFSLDNVMYKRIETWAGNLPYPAPFDQKFFILLQTSVGASGSWIGYPDATTVFPSTTLVEYIKVYQ